MPESSPRPEVTLTGSSLLAGAEPEAPPRSRLPRLLLVLVPLLVLALALTGGEPAPEPPDVVVDADLAVLGERLSVTQGGVLVVPVELVNRGPALTVRRAEVYAEPVREDPVLQAPRDVAAADGKRFVALLEPDCRLLRPGSPLRFSAGVLLRVGLGSVDRDLVVDLAADPAVRERVVGLCGGGG